MLNQGSTEGIQSHALADPRAMRAAGPHWAKLIAAALFWLGFFTLGCFIDTRPVQRMLDGEAATTKHVGPVSGEPSIILLRNEQAAGDVTAAVCQPLLAKQSRNPGFDAPATSDHAPVVEHAWKEFVAKLPDNSYRIIKLLLCWTWTNIFFLCCAAALLGQYGAALSAKHETRKNFHSAFIKGVFVYLLALTGQLVANGSLHPAKHDATHAEIHTDDGHYFRIAGVASFAAFSLGYHPELLTGLGQRLSRLDDESPADAERSVYQ